MNRSERRAAAARGKPAAGAAPADIDGLLAQAKEAYNQGRLAPAEALCKQILARAPAHLPGLNLLGVINQASGRHRVAVKTFARALAANELDAACHYNIATSYQDLDEREAAAAHFRKAIALGLGGKDIEDFVLENPHVADFARRASENAGVSTASSDFLGDGEIAAIANDVFLQCALQSTLLRGVTLEFFLTRLRGTLLRLAMADVGGAHDAAAATFCALAQQCFIDEYVLAHTDAEIAQASELRERLLRKLSEGSDVSAILLAAVAAYFPLHSLPGAQSLLAATWPDYAADLIRQQVREPLEEADDRRAIPALTAIDDATSIEVMQQYEENPYPRWTINPLAAFGSDTNSDATEEDILIAGCGNGQHAFDVAQQRPQARILAIDISRPSLAYARRKTRQAGLRNIDYAQADILRLGALGRSFDRIEAVGVLHHLADPKAGWRVLLGLLKPNGLLRVGLYSEAARRSIVEARALIAERGYRPTADGIRALRQSIIRDRNEPRWKFLLATADDFYSMSGCRDLFFNVMEHRTTIPEIAALLDEQGLSFLGFELDGKTVERFRQQYPGAGGLTNLGYWNSFEAANPQTFRHMYVFSVRKNEPPAAATHEKS